MGSGPPVARLEILDGPAIIRLASLQADSQGHTRMPDGAATATEIIHVDDRTVACDGGDGALGHPRVFLHIEAESVMCPYCSRLYVLNDGAGHASGH
jgi:uncharacterized Zn-finger protein